MLHMRGFFKVYLSVMVEVSMRLPSPDGLGGPQSMQLPSLDGFTDASSASQNVPSGLLVRFIREHRSEWVDYGVVAYSAASVKTSPYSVPRVGACNDLYIFWRLHDCKVMDLTKKILLQRTCFYYSGMDKNSVNSCAQLVFAPIDEAFADDVHLLPSGFRVIPLESKMDLPTWSRTLDLASALEVGTAAISDAANKNTSHTYNCRSVLTIAFQITYEDHLSKMGSFT